MSAAKKKWIPDVTVAFTYTKGQKEDYIGMSTVFPFPISAHKHVRKALSEKK